MVTADEPKILDEKLNETQTVSQEAQNPAEVSETAEALDIIEIINRWEVLKIMVRESENWYQSISWRSEIRSNIYARSAMGSKGSKSK